MLYSAVNGYPVKLLKKRRDMSSFCKMPDVHIVYRSELVNIEKYLYSNYQPVGVSLAMESMSPFSLMMKSDVL